jgi:hypothetical protein
LTFVRSSATRYGFHTETLQTENLLGYKEKSGKGLNPAPTAFLFNQFGQQVQRLGQRRELCVPTELAP